MKRPANRWIAFAIHFAISTAIFLIFLALITLWWYPGALFFAAGGLQGIKIVAGVDLVLGPLLTLIIYNTAKPLRELNWDLSIIALIQVSCLSMGVYIVVNERPVAVVYAFDTFYTIKSADLVDTNSPADLLSKFPGPSPKKLFVELPPLREEAEAVVAAHLFLAEPLQLRSNLYHAIPTEKGALENMFQFNTEAVNPSCTRIKLATYYANGSACYNADKQRLEDFQPSDR